MLDAATEIGDWLLVNRQDEISVLLARHAEDDVSVFAEAIVNEYKRSVGFVRELCDGYLRERGSDRTGGNVVALAELVIEGLHWITVAEHIRERSLATV